MKYVSYFILIFALYFMISNYISSKNIIPDEAIRVRIIANSNEDYDQSVKMKVKDIVTDDMYNLLKDTKDITSARTKIEKNISLLDDEISNYFNEINYNMSYDINFGYNFFPEKTYKGINYKAGNYESLVVKIGEAKGDNWWCVLFPPVCMIEAEENEDVEYTTLVKDLVNKYF